MTLPEPDRLDPAFERALDEQLANAGDEALLGRVKGRVLAGIREAPAPGHWTVRAGEGAWQRIAPGVHRKVLWSAGGVMACVLRCEAGAQLPGHFHPVDEECIVLEGSMRIEPDIELQAGDFHLGQQGTRHGAASTQGGCVVYLRGAVEACAS